MITLLTFAFISGLVTIAAPCIWPLLPILFSSSSQAGHGRPLGITVGIISSFAVVTLSLSYIVSLIPLDPDLLRVVAVGVIVFFGLTLLIPRLGQMVEGAVSRMSRVFGSTTQGKGNGFASGFVVGLALGIVWTPCAGPILATIATLAATQAVSLQIVFVTLAYVLGVGVPLFLFSILGNRVIAKSRVMTKYTGTIQQVFGAVMIGTALLILTGQDRVLQTKLLDVFPQYSQFLVRLESNETVQKQLKLLKAESGQANSGFNGGATNASADMLPILGQAPGFTGITRWINTEDESADTISLAQLKGRVVLVDFWTYTCINCIRTLPFVTSWYEKYKDQGFVVIGVHTPEFEFEKDTANVQQAILQYKIRYPVAQDNNFATWNAYDNHYWPAHYLIDANGNIRYTHFGEGEYDVTEENIRKLLMEAGKRTTNQNLRLKDAAPRNSFQTPETYLGSARAEANSYVMVDNTWTQQPEYIESSSQSTLDLDFSADKVFLVITSENDGKFEVLLDGKPISATVSGSDVKNGVVQIDTARLYNLVNLKGKVGSHSLKLIFRTPKIRLFAFTFG